MRYAKKLQQQMTNKKYNKKNWYDDYLISIHIKFLDIFNADVAVMKRRWSDFEIGNGTK